MDILTYVLKIIATKLGLVTIEIRYFSRIVENLLANIFGKK
jgi:hypothetical protein